jgi:hypothetical protein
MSTLLLYLINCFNWLNADYHLLEPQYTFYSSKYCDNIFLCASICVKSFARTTLTSHFLIKILLKYHHLLQNWSLSPLWSLAPWWSFWHSTITTEYLNYLFIKLSFLFNISCEQNFKGRTYIFLALEASDGTLELSMEWLGKAYWIDQWIIKSHVNLK